MDMTHTFTRRLRVTGRLWCGSECEHEYPLKEGQAVKTMAEAKRIAGDFESLESAEVETHESVICEEISVQTIDK